MNTLPLWPSGLSSMMCASLLIALGGCTTAPNGRSDAIKVLSETGHTDDGTAFTSTLTHADRVAPCPQGGEIACVRYTLRTTNPSDEALLCDASLQGEPFKTLGLQPGMVTPGQSVSLQFSLSATSVVSAMSMQCHRPAAPAESPECKPEFTRTAYVNLLLPGPPPSQSDELKPVVLEYTLRAAQGHPSDISVISSSHFPQLDAAAIKIFSAQIGKTACPGHRFRAPVRPTLR